MHNGSMGSIFDIPRPAPDASRETDLVHLLDESIDLLLPIPQVTTLNEVLELPRPESARGVGKLKRLRSTSILVSRKRL